MKEIKIPELALEGMQLQLVPWRFRTGSLGFQGEQANVIIDGRKYWVKIMIVEQGTKRLS